MDKYLLKFITIFNFWQTGVCFLNKIQQKECLVTSRGLDGFGHQLEAKISCVIADILSSRIRYIHSPFVSMAHVDLMDEDFPSMVENFTNMGYGSNRIDESGPQYTLNITDSRWVKLADSGTAICSNNIVNVVDNCWEFIYFHPRVSRLDESKHEIRRRYFSSPKPDPKFVPERFNVVIHIRRGDAGPRRLPLGYIFRPHKFIDLTTFPSPR